MHTALRSQRRSVLYPDLRAPCTHRYALPRCSFHNNARLRLPDIPRPGLGAANTGTASHVEKPDAQNVLAGKTGNQKPSKKTLAGNTNVPHTDGAEAAGSEPPEIPERTKASVYGSNSRRIQRRRIREPPPPKALPQWFIDRNVLFAEDLTSLERREIQIVESSGGSSPRFLDGASTSSPIEAESGMLMEASESTAESGAAKHPPNTPHAFGEDIKQSVGDAGSEETSHMPDSNRSPSPISGAQLPSSKYFIEAGQVWEILSTARGLLRLPTGDRLRASDVIFQKNHLLLHYPAKNGEVFLDKVVQRVARELNCDLMVLDAQDIAALIVNSDPGDDLVTDARLLGYDVHVRQKEVVSFPMPSIADPAEAEDDGAEADEIDESSRAGNHPPFGGMPVLMGRPITINLSQFLKPSRDGAGNSVMSRIMSGLTGQESPKQKEDKHIFAEAVNTILSAPYSKHTLAPDGSQATLSGGVSPYAASEDKADARGLIIHVRDLKAIQEMPIGKQFLSELYEQVQGRRLDKEKMMIVGTESSQQDPKIWGFSGARIDEMQKGELEEISRTIVLTPVTPTAASRLALIRDKKRRTRMINLRHLWEMLQYKSSSPNNEPPDWNSANSEPLELSAGDKHTLEQSVWSFSSVHRLAAIQWGNADQDDPMKQLSIFQVAENLAASDQLKKDWVTREGSDKADGPESMIRKAFNMDAPDKQPAKITLVRSQATKHEKKLLGGVIEPDKIKTTFEDVHCPVETIETLQTLTTLSLIRPEAFKYGVLASDKLPGLLLYGPPGTGKTLLAKAVAKESGTTMLEVSGANLQDMYVGEGEKNVQALFSLAKKLSPCIVFLDEADAMFRSRSTDSRRANHRELINQFLKEWDGLSSDSASAFIMVATNRPMDLDDAVLRRLPRRLLVDLPTEKDRLEILKIHLRDEVIASDVDLATLAKNTPFYSGSDLKNVAVAAALECVREENEMAKAHRQTSEEPYEYAAKRTLTVKHFDKALEDISASISEDMTSLKEIKKFDEQYGDKRGKKKRKPSWGFSSAEEAEKVLDTVKVRS